MVSLQGTACEGPIPPPPRGAPRLLWRVNSPSLPRPSPWFLELPQEIGCRECLPLGISVEGNPSPSLLRRPSREKSASEGS
ncbi:Hypothetical protein FKW44_022744 [Caligus rogercresseyi]|uniref:Uncharacterized protein n=1 Tax=Caligus rogercresseyi TaxID=217165 RepID=A0A7T8JTP1_CALRO|nr:Hypothetical protein FKW44_022744 [Caligus rogercresseyi]